MFKKEWIDENKKFNIGDSVLYEGKRHRVVRLDSNVVGEILYIIKRELKYGNLGEYRKTISDISLLSPI